MRPSEVAEVATLHRTTFPDYESSRLGPAFCQRLLNAYSVRTDACVLVAGGDGGPITGYLVGCPPRVQRAVNDDLALRGAVAYGARALRSPKQVAAGLGTAWRRARRVVTQRIRPSTPSAVPTPVEQQREAGARVVLIGVAASARGTGVGDALLEGFADRARGWGATRADLVVEADNAPARRAYERNGWEAQPVGPGEQSDRYWLELGPPPP